MSPNLNVKGETKPGIWITGTSSGIGKFASLEFASAGATVFATARRLDELGKLQFELNGENNNLRIMQCDVRSRMEVEQTAKKIITEHDIDCLVNNAGITSFIKAEDNSIADIENIIHTNLLGSIYTIKNILPHMIENKSGTIINILSIVTKKIFTHSSAYAASKMGLLGYTNSLREEVRKYNIRIINIIPGATETLMWPKEIRDEKSAVMINPERIASVIKWAYFQKGNMVPEEIVLRPALGDL